GYITTAVSEDREAARRNAAAIIAFNSTVKTYRAVHRVSGFEAEAEAIRDAWSRGDFAGMTAAVTDEMIDAIALAGTPDEVRERLPNAPHWVHHDEAGQVNRLLIDFFAPARPGQNRQASTA